MHEGILRGTVLLLKSWYIGTSPIKLLFNDVGQETLVMHVFRPLRSHIWPDVLSGNSSLTVGTEGLFLGVAEWRL